ncbi:MAG: immunoglobulin domain-containing protein [Verrucomicrobiae bacterium]|nr:immunoglobulin domain-containing protein [Verrucomicrobiae bacterium]
MSTSKHSHSVPAWEPSLGVASTNLQGVARALMGAVVVGAVVWLAAAAQGQSVVNGGFEADTFNVAPGYASDNAPITGWTAAGADGVGLNPAGGESPFANNGAIPEGSQVAFIWPFGYSLATTVGGLTSGERYRVQLRANVSEVEGFSATAVLRAAIDGTDAIAVNVYPVGGTAPYATLAFEFTAGAASQTLELFNDAPDEGTLLIDDVRVVASSGRWSIEPWTNDDDSGVNAQYVYTHAYNFGSAAGTSINGVAFTGVAGGNPAVSGRFSSTYLGSVFNNDGNNVTGGSRTLANDFVYGGTVPAGEFQSVRLEGLTPGVEYVFAVYTVGWEAPSPSIRWLTGSIDGTEALTFNQDQFGNDNGMVISHRYTADASGVATLRFAPVNPANVSMHFYGFSNREAVSRNVAPSITLEPSSQIVSQGLPVTFRVAAAGFPAPTYQWQFQGADLSGETAATLEIPAAGSANVGDYRVIVRNTLGSVTSQTARLTVGLAMENPSFEADAFPYWPGYSGDNPGGAGTDPGFNGPITGWIQDNEAGTGINPIANGASPFANSGTIPHGERVAFLQADSTLSQTVSGLTVGADYYVHYLENARAGGTPALELLRDGEVAVPVHTIPPGEYRSVYTEVFQAIATSATLTFVKSNPLGGDTTALLDNVAVVPVPAGTAPFLTREPRAVLANPGETVTFSAQALGSLPLGYLWRKGGEAVAGATGTTLTLSDVGAADEGLYSLVVSNTAGVVTTEAVRLTVGLPGIYGTGVGEDGGLLEGGVEDPHYRLVSSADEGAPGPEAWVLNDGWPIQAGVWMLNGPSSKWIGPQADQSVGNAEGEYVYETRFHLTGVDVTRVRLMGGWATDNTGLDILVNGQSTGITASGFGSLTPFEIASGLVEGENVLQFRMSNLPVTPNPTGLRVDLMAVVHPQDTAPTLQIVRDAGGLTLSWSPASAGQTLQSAPAITGPWTDVAGATSPYSTTATDGERYYRVAQ